MTIHIESTKTNDRTRKIPMTEDVYRCFQGILEDRETPMVEKKIDGYSSFLFLGKEDARGGNALGTSLQSYGQTLQ